MLHVASYNLRPMRAEDIPSVESIHKECFPVVYDPPFFTGLLQSDSLTVVACDIATGEVVGVATGRAGRGRTAYLATLGVTASHRRMGIATDMLETILRKFETQKRSKSVSLHCKFGNDVALAFYRRAGFQVEAKLLDHYDINGKVHDAFLIRRKLNPPPSQWWKCLTDCWRKVRCGVMRRSSE